jgi:hypothetical protein
MSFYPSQLASFSNKVDNVSTIFAADVNNLQNEIIAIETAIGLNPQGSTVSLVSRLASLISSTGTLLAGTVGSSQIINSSIGSTQIANGSVHNYHLAPDAFSSVSGAILVNSVNIINPNLKNGNGFTFSVSGSDITLSGGGGGSTVSTKSFRVSAHNLTVVSGAASTGTPFGIADIIPVSPLDGISSLTHTLKRFTVWLNVAPSGGTLVLATYKNGVFLHFYNVTSGTKSVVFSGLSDSFTTNDIIQIGVVGNTVFGSSGLSYGLELSVTY